MQRVAVRVAVYVPLNTQWVSSVVEGDAVCCSLLQCVLQYMYHSTHNKCRVLLSVMQCVAVCCSACCAVYVPLDTQGRREVLHQHSTQRHCNNSARVAVYDTTRYPFHPTTQESQRHRGRTEDEEKNTIHICIIYMYIYTYIHICIYMVCIYIYEYVYIYTYIYEHTSWVVQIYIHRCIYLYIYVLCTYMYIYTDIYTWKCIHEHTSWVVQIDPTPTPTHSAWATSCAHIYMYIYIYMNMYTWAYLLSSADRTDTHAHSQRIGAGFNQVRSLPCCYHVAAYYIDLRVVRLDMPVCVCLWWVCCSVCCSMLQWRLLHRSEGSLPWCACLVCVHVRSVLPLMLQCVAVCKCVAVRCSVLQCVQCCVLHLRVVRLDVPVCVQAGRVFQRVAVYICCVLLQCFVAVYCSVLQCVAVCCSVLQCAAMCCNVPDHISLECRVTLCCSVLQCVAVCCSVLQCTWSYQLGM